MSRTSIQRQIKQSLAAQAREQQAHDSISAADHYTVADRAAAETLEAAELFAAFIAEEI